MAERTGIVNTSLIVYLCAALIVTGGISAFPVAGWASFVPSDGGLSAPAFDREADLAQLKTHLERRVVAQRLADWASGRRRLPRALANSATRRSIKPWSSSTACNPEAIAGWE
jgi:hypothetical protein